MLFVFRSKTLHNYCLQFLVEVKMAPREPETMLMQNFGVTNQEHYGMLWYFWSGQLFSYSIAKALTWRYNL